MNTKLDELATGLTVAAFVLALITGMACARLAHAEGTGETPRWLYQSWHDPMADRYRFESKLVSETGVATTDEDVDRVNAEEGLKISKGGKVWPALAARCTDATDGSLQFLVDWRFVHVRANGVGPYRHLLDVRWGTGPVEQDTFGNSVGGTASWVREDAQRRFQQKLKEETVLRVRFTEGERAYSTAVFRLDGSHREITKLERLCREFRNPIAKPRRVIRNHWSGYWYMVKNDRTVVCPQKTSPPRECVDSAEAQLMGLEVGEMRRLNAGMKISVGELPGEVVPEVRGALRDRRFPVVLPGVTPKRPARAATEPTRRGAVPTGHRWAGSPEGSGARPDPRRRCG